MSDYQPISCSLHDRLESFTVLRRSMRVTYASEGGVERTLDSRIRDIHVESGEEFMILEAGPRVRLDRILRIQELPIP